MKFSKGKLNNVNKKILAGGLALTMICTSLTGCLYDPINDIKYTKNELGYIQSIDGNVNYKILEFCHFQKVRNKITQEEYYTIVLQDKDFFVFFITYYDIFTKQNLTEGDFEFEIVGSITDYLIAFNMVKEAYSEEELKEILNKFIEIQEKENNKQLVKEK